MEYQRGLFIYNTCDKLILSAIEVCGLSRPKSLVTTFYMYRYLIGWKQDNLWMLGEVNVVIKVIKNTKEYFQELRSKEAGKIFICHWWLSANHCWYEVFARDSKIDICCPDWLRSIFYCKLLTFRKLSQWQ